jgi:hypothetical protein
MWRYARPGKPDGPYAHSLHRPARRKVGLEPRTDILTPQDFQIGRRDRGGAEITHCGLVRVKVGTKIVRFAASDSPPFLIEWQDNECILDRSRFLSECDSGKCEAWSRDYMRYSVADCVRDAGYVVVETSSSRPSTSVIPTREDADSSGVTATSHGAKATI